MPTSDQEFDYKLESHDVLFSTSPEHPFGEDVRLTVSRSATSVSVRRLDSDAMVARPASLDSVLEDMEIRSRRDARRFPGNASSVTNLGLALLNRGKLDEAAAEFSRALARDPDLVAAILGLARVRVLQERLDEGSQLYRRLRDLRPDSSAPFVGLGLIAAERQQFTEALQLLHEAVSLDPDDVDAHMHLGLVLLSQDRKQEAISALRKATRQNVRSAPLHLSLGIAYVATGNWDRAERAFKVALSLAPDPREAVHALAVCYLAQKRLEDAVDLLQDHLNGGQRDAAARDMLALALFGQRRYVPAISHLQVELEWIDEARAESASEKARLLNNLGLCRWANGQPRQAEKQFLEAIRLCRDERPAPYLNLAQLYRESDRLVSARDTLRQCSSYFPDAPNVAMLLAVTLAELGEIDQAIDLLERFVRDELADAAIYALLGGLYTDDRGDVEAAVRVLREGWSRHHDFLPLGNNLAYAYLMGGNTVEARAILEPLVAAGHRHPSLRCTWGLLQIWEGQLDEGARYYREAETVAGEAGLHNLVHVIRQKLHLELARAHTRQGRMNDARSEIQLGLAENGRRSYRHDLETLARELITS